MKILSTLIIFCTAFTAFTSFAQTDTMELAPVEVKAVRASAIAPFTKTNLIKSELEKRNLGQDLPLLLNYTPSVVVYSDAGNGVGYTGIRIRGTDATRINVTLNGVPFNDAESGGTFLVDLPDFVSSVQSIQIQRGVGTSSNGGGSFGASINISTNEVEKEGGMELNNSYGSFITMKNTIKYNSGLIKNKITIDGRISRVVSDGYIDRAESNLKSFYFSSAYLGTKSTVRLNIFSGKEKTYQAWYGVSEMDLKTNRTKNIAGTAKPDEPYDNETDNYTQHHYQLFFNHKILPSLIFNTGIFLVKGNGYYEQYKAAQSYSDYNILPPVNTNFTESDLVRRLGLDNDFYGNIFSLHHEKGKSAIIVGGAITNYEGKHLGDVVWAEKGLINNRGRWYDLNAEKSDWNFYGKWQEALTPSIQLYTDLQFRKVNHQINGFRNTPDIKTENKYSFFNPKIGFSYLKDQWSAYASYAIANKEPNRDDFETGKAQMPKPEQLHNVEAGINYKNSNMNLNVSLYYMKYKDQLALTGKINDVGAYTRTNINDSYRAGIETGMNVKLTKWMNASGNFTFSRNKIKNYTEFVDDYDNGGQISIAHRNTIISFSPDITSGASINFNPFANMELSLSGKYVSKQYLDNTSNDQRKLDANYTQDLLLSYTFTKKALKNIRIIAQANNIFNAFYEPNGYTFSYFYENKLNTENFYFPMAGRNWMLGVNVKL
jgi:iron complex outermembrane receptor protein